MNPKKLFIPDPNLYTLTAIIIEQATVDYKTKGRIINYTVDNDLLIDFEYANPDEEDLVDVVFMRENTNTPNFDSTNFLVLCTPVAENVFIPIAAYGLTESVVTEPLYTTGGIEIDYESEDSPSWDFEETYTPSGKCIFAGFVPYFDAGPLYGFKILYDVGDYPTIGRPAGSSAGSFSLLSSITIRWKILAYSGSGFVLDSGTMAGIEALTSFSCRRALNTFVNGLKVLHEDISP